MTARNAIRYDIFSIRLDRPGDSRATGCRSPRRISTGVGLHADESGEGCRTRGEDWIGGRQRHQLARGVSRLPRPALLRDAGDLVVSRVEPAAPRRGIFAVPLPVRGQRPGAARWAHRPDSGHRAVDDLRTGELQLSRALRSERPRFRGQQSQLDPVAGVGGVCHRRAQLQGRLSGLQPDADDAGGSPTIRSCDTRSTTGVPISFGYVLAHGGTRPIAR